MSRIGSVDEKLFSRLAESMKQHNEIACGERAASIDDLLPAIARQLNALASTVELHIAHSAAQEHRSTLS